jgi:CubicO group peptidase (beta-lactamase class C family)
VARDVDEVVTTAVRAAFADGEEVGMQVAVCVNGALIVDVCAGLADQAERRPVEAGTLFPVFSVTKGVVSTAILQAVDDGLLALDAPICRYWPSFGDSGKAEATVAHLLTHAIGIPAMPDRCSVRQMCDWDYMVAAIETMRPLWKPGTETGYHAYTFGWIAGELLRRVRPGSPTVGECVATMLNRVGAADFWIGLPPAKRRDVATLYADPGRPLVSPTALFDLALPAEIRPKPAVFNQTPVQLACLPAAGGIGTATALARMYDALASDARHADPQQTRLLTHETATTAARLHTDAADVVLGTPVRKGLGYFLGGGESLQTAPMATSRAFGHPGSGGSTAWADTTYGAGIAITRNWMAGPADSSIMTVAAAARRAVELVATAGRVTQ